VNDDIGTLTGEFKRDRSPDPAATARTGYERDPPAEWESVHVARHAAQFYQSFD
jgi:hypothetical protein